ncbi:cGMP-dependent protein kinase, isozyme 1-like [Diorhabda sublineata]|uniref:cGMP-dependent protein kinase, isozyme 1-like n=1 Tax=Diorhabda sublineata TaxID=1163346 RepID=UPI0024E15E6C|nr:cGMP-dependent protein kinase, isozyme 1-like [Diorhabda sublineata]
MVFCLCRRRGFNETLVINSISKGQYKTRDENKHKIINIKIKPITDGEQEDGLKDVNKTKILANGGPPNATPQPNYNNSVVNPNLQLSNSEDEDYLNPDRNSISKSSTERVSLKSIDTENQRSSTPDLDTSAVEPKPKSGKPNSKKHKAPPPPQVSDQQVDTRKSNASEIDISSSDQNENMASGSISVSSVENDEQRREGIAVRIDANLDEKLPVYMKDPHDAELIRKAIEKNEFLYKIISKEHLDEVISAMYNREVSAKETIIKQGDKGKHMYISASGTFQIIIKGKLVDEFNDVRVFGEISILHNSRRLATIRAATAGRVWVLDNTVYQQIKIRHAIKQEDEIQEFLMNNEILNVVGKEALQVVSTLLKSEFYNSGEKIVKQGDRGDKFFIIRAGTVTITTEKDGIVGVYKKGDCFGELALLEEDCRKATVTANAPGVECLTLTRQEFIAHFGEVKKFKYIRVPDKPKDSIHSVNAEFDEIDLRDLKIKKTIGVGGFGRVELVQHVQNDNIVFALKYLKKIEIVQQCQQEHVFNEKVIQMSSRSPFIVRLYRTYKDRKYVYFLMEACLGGDLWSLLQRHKNRRFDEKDAIFICACVLLAFEYLHQRGIIYRDLKPENLLIAANGYIKLTDFGFSKKIVGVGKTYTFAGTPEYVAPEIVLNRGHDRAVDYWAFGVFVFEMLTGRTPFRTDDSTHMKTYNMILTGIDSTAFPTYINLKARQLIQKLCRPVPSERLGMHKNGILDIKNHKWFGGVDWQKFANLHVASPFKPKLSGPADTKYFDNFKKDTDNPPDELSGWDEKF